MEGKNLFIAILPFESQIFRLNSWSNNFSNADLLSFKSWLQKIFLKKFSKIILCIITFDSKQPIFDFLFPMFSPI